VTESRGPAQALGSVTGLVVIDKEAGWTSHDVVARCRRIFGLRKVGHAGTLDPDATGVLLVGLGRATRLMRFLTALPKTYTTDIVLGTATSTLDASGEVVATYDMSHVTPDDVAAAAAGLTGDIEQVPPMVSAVKVGGRRLHELAREGIEVDRPARPVTVTRFDTAPDPSQPGVYRAEVVCSSGTYIRVLAQDLGRALGGDAYVKNLRRTRIGSFGGPEMHPLDAIGPDDVLTPAQALRDMDAVTVSPDAAASIRTGLPLDRVPLGALGDGPWAMLDEAGQLLAVYEATDSDRIRPAVVLAGPGETVLLAGPADGDPATATAAAAESAAAADESAAADAAAADQTSADQRSE
jgi:tRNA pseudouridine55 synthase